MIEAIGSVPIVTGDLTDDAKRVYSGRQRGIRYEIYFDPGARTARRRRKGRSTSRTGDYIAVVFTPYPPSIVNGVTRPGGVEAELVGRGSTVEAARDVAADYIEVIHKQDIRYGIEENPIARTVLIVGGVVVGAAAIGGIAYALTRKTGTSGGGGGGGPITVPSQIIQNHRYQVVITAPPNTPVGNVQSASDLQTLLDGYAPGIAKVESVNFTTGPSSVSGTAVIDYLGPTKQVGTLDPSYQSQAAAQHMTIAVTDMGPVS